LIRRKLPVFELLLNFFRIWNPFGQMPQMDAISLA